MTSRNSHNLASETFVDCYLCGHRGEEFYRGLPDRYFGSPGRWNFSRCPSCGLMWLSPRPATEKIGQVYSSYYTHEGHEGEIAQYLKSFRGMIERSVLSACFSYASIAESDRERQLGRLMGAIPPLNDFAGASVMYLELRGRKRLLDVGSGSGNFLAKMKGLGWQVTGLDPDPRVNAELANELGIVVVSKPLLEADFEESYFDAITLNHVIEHVHAPVAFLKECHRILKPGGRLVVITPNGESLGHNFFGRNWRGLEPPRHTYIFSESNLRTVVEGADFEIQRLWTIARMAVPVWHQSRPRHALVGESRLAFLSLRGLGALFFYLGEELAKLFERSVGEELVAIARKDGKGFERESS